MEEELRGRMGVNMIRMYCVKLIEILKLILKKIITNF